MITSEKQLQSLYLSTTFIVKVHPAYHEEPLRACKVYSLRVSVNHSNRPVCCQICFYGCVRKWGIAYNLKPQITLKIGKVVINRQILGNPIFETNPYSKTQAKLKYLSCSTTYGTFCVIDYIIYIYTHSMMKMGEIPCDFSSAELWACSWEWHTICL